jgi:hypothetical protein
MIFAIDTAGSILWEHETEPVTNQKFEPYEYAIRDHEGGWIVSQPRGHRPEQFSESTWTEISRIKKLDSDFNELWSIDIDVIGPAFYKGISALSIFQDNIFVSGSNLTKPSDTDASPSTSFLTKINLEGKVQWERYDSLYINTNPNEFNLLINNKHIILPSGSIMMCGTLQTYSGKYYGFLMKLDKDGCLEPGCHITSSVTDVVDVAGITIYPNPARNEITIDWEDGKLMSQKFILLDQYGKQHVNLYITNGAKIDVSFLNSGVYYYSISNERNTNSLKKLMVIK